MDDEDTPMVAIKATKPKCVADLCTGRGLIPYSAMSQGVKFVGMELNKRRLAVMLDKTTRELGAKWTCGG